MMASNAVYEPNYAGSRALVIGINQYQVASPLDYACNDAEKFSQTLVERFNFPAANVTSLQDERATRENILSAFLDFGTGSRSRRVRAASA